MSNPQTVVGSVVGTGAIMNIIIGFTPDYVELVNTTDGDAVEKWYRGMAANTSINAGGAAPVTRAAPNGINAYEGPLGSGFTISAALAENTKTLRYLAIRSGPGAN